jgi:hypothetical protein
MSMAKIRYLDIQRMSSEDGPACARPFSQGLLAGLRMVP